MKALVVQQFGIPPAMGFEERPKPNWRSGHSLVRMKAASINQLSNTIRSGLFAGTNAPLILGNEGSGFVEESDAFVQGTRVVIYGGSTLGVREDGLLQEWVLVDNNSLVEVPANLSFEEGAAFAVNYLTAYRAITATASIQPGQTAVISGATGSLGYACLQIALAVGASPIALVSSNEKARRMFEAGKFPVVNWTTHDVQNEVLRHTDGKGADFAFDPVGGQLLNILFKSLRARGTVVALGFTGGKEPSFDLVDAIVAEKRIVGYSLHAEEQSAAAKGLQAVISLAAEGKVRPVIDTCFDVADFAKAYDRLTSREAAGSIIVTFS